MECVSENQQNREVRQRERLNVTIGNFHITSKQCYNLHIVQVRSTYLNMEAYDLLNILNIKLCTILKQLLMHNECFVKNISLGDHKYGKSIPFGRGE